MIREQLVQPAAADVATFLQLPADTHTTLRQVAGQMRVVYQDGGGHPAQVAPTLLVLERDGSLHIHRPGSEGTLTWPPNTATISAAVEDGNCVLTIHRIHPVETVRVVMLDITLMQALESNEGPSLSVRPSGEIGRLPAKGLEESGSRAEVLAVLGDVLQRATTPEAVAEQALPHIAPALRAQSMLVVRLNGQGIETPTLWGAIPEPIRTFMMRPGLTLGEAPMLYRAAETEQGCYLDDYRRTPGTVATFPSLAVGVEPIQTPNGTLEGFLVVWRAVSPSGWQDGERDLLRRAANTLGLALERAQNMEQLEARNRVLAAAEDWSRDLRLDTDTDAMTLIRRAQELLYDSLRVQTAVYYEREGDLWLVRSMLGDYGNEDLRRAHENGLPHAITGNLRIPFETGEVRYQDEYDVTTDALQKHTAHVGATAMLPLKTTRGVRGIFGLALFERTGWTPTNRAIIETVGSSLAVAIDRADQALELARERAGLAAANEELEAFAYSVSHDLRTPVRHIMSFNRLLHTFLGAQLHPKAARYLQVVEESAERMNTLIDAMLELSRTSRQLLNVRLLDLGALVSVVRSELEPETLERTVVWQVGALPLVLADHDLLRQVLINLLSNALKYTRTRDAAQIAIWAEEREEAWEISVRDNGVGFDPRYADKIFGVFQRLHRQEEFEGTGVGLANVRRIIARHGGRVWAHSQLNQGATFVFTLPKDN